MTSNLNTRHDVRARRVITRKNEGDRTPSTGESVLHCRPSTELREAPAHHASKPAALSSADRPRMPARRISQLLGSEHHCPAMGSPACSSSANRIPSTSHPTRSNRAEPPGKPAGVAADAADTRHQDHPARCRPDLSALRQCDRRRRGALHPAAPLSSPARYLGAVDELPVHAADIVMNRPASSSASLIRGTWNVNTPAITLSGADEASRGFDGQCPQRRRTPARQQFSCRRAYPARLRGAAAPLQTARCRNSPAAADPSWHLALAGQGADEDGSGRWRMARHHGSAPLHRRIRRARWPISWLALDGVRLSTGRNPGLAAVGRERRYSRG